MNLLSETQRAILTAALERYDCCILPLPDRLKGGAAGKVITSLIGSGFVEEVDARKGDLIWRQTGDGHGVTLVMTALGAAAIGAPVDEAPRLRSDGETASQPHDASGARLRRPAAPAAPAARYTREGSKQALMIERLGSDNGATLSELIEATGWQAHTVRGAMAGALKKKLGLTIVSEKVEGRGRVYRLA